MKLLRISCAIALLLLPPFVFAQAVSGRSGTLAGDDEYEKRTGSKPG